VYNLPAADLDTLYALEVRESINGLLFTDPDTYLFEMTIGLGQPWSVTGSDQHPFHVHVNHMQYSANVDDNQWTEVPDWNVAGDWVDSLSSPGIAIMYVRPERFIGHMVMHCHISEHSDSGIVAVVNIAGDGDDGTGSPEITDFGTCLEEIPASTPYGGVSWPIPGVIEAEDFDEGGEGIAYHNKNIDENISNSYRIDTAVEIRTSDDVIFVASIRNEEWLKYSVNVADDGFYTLSLSTGALNPPNGMQWSLYLDVLECPAPAELDDLVVAVSNDAYVGTGSYLIFEVYDVTEPLELTAGEHTLTFCYETDAYLALDSFTFNYCGITVELCDGSTTTSTSSGNDPATLGESNSGVKPQGILLGSALAVLLSYFLRA
jgi:hypothetical protein